MSCEGCVGAVKRVLGKMEGCLLFLLSILCCIWYSMKCSILVIPTSNLNLNRPWQILQLVLGESLVK
uniref:Uncharacterized protein n=1 Tax=Arundo donax TaxID=35708 RepID=A0A0A9EP30_ARUDO